MKVVETRYPCPVCLGVTLEKLHIDHAPPKATAVVAPVNGELVLDHCGRCGGVWFGPGEVQQLGRVDQARLWALIARRNDVHNMQCHNCHAHLARSERKCASCGWNVRLDCPVCQRVMEQAEQPLRAEPARPVRARSTHPIADSAEPAGRTPSSETRVQTAHPLTVRLDVCRSCKGVWFDHDELEAIWRLEVNALVQRRRAGEELGVGSVALLEALTYDPFLMYFGMQAAGHAIGGAAQVLSGASGALANAPEAAVGMVEAAGEAASSVFETIVEIIASIFE